MSALNLQPSSREKGSKLAAPSSAGPSPHWLNVEVLQPDDAATVVEITDLTTVALPLRRQRERDHSFERSAMTDRGHHGILVGALSQIF